MDPAATAPGSHQSAVGEQSAVRERLLGTDRVLRQLLNHIAEVEPSQDEALDQLVRRAKRVLRANTASRDRALELSRARVSGRRERFDPDRVLRGRDGWLFLQRDGNDVIGQHTGKVSLGGRAREAWRSTLRRRTQLTEHLGVSWMCAIVPDKETVYAELLPPEVTPATRRPVHEILDIAADVGAPVVYLRDELRSARGRLPVYAVTGTHWNDLGAFIAYQAVCSRLRDAGFQFPELLRSDVRWERYRTADDLGSKLKPPLEGESVRAVIPATRARIVFDNRIINHGRTMIFEREGDGPRAIIFGESFVPYLIPFFKESFRRLVFVHTSTLAPELLGHERPDIALSFPTERFMIRVPRDNSAMRRMSEDVQSKRERGAVLPHTQTLFRSIPGANEIRNDGEFPWPRPGE